jgi:hypothetical protein
LIRRKAHALRHVARHAKNLPSKLHGQPRGNQRPAEFRALHNHHPSGIPATMRLRTGKFSGAGCVRVGN